MLHVLGSLGQGGAESRIMDIYRTIDRSKLQFDFVIHTDEECYYCEEVKSLGGRVFVVSKFKGYNLLKYILNWFELFRKEPRYSIIHGHMTSTAIVYLSIARLFDFKMRISHSRSASKSSLMRRYTSKLSSVSATHKLAVSKLAAISEFGDKSVENKQVLIVPNAIHTKKYVYNKGARSRVRQINKWDDKVVIGHVGSFRYPKNHSFIIEIFKALNLHLDNTILVLIGDGELMPEIKKIVIDYNLQDKVVFMGNRSDVPELLQAIDLLLFPSIYEGLPGVVLEAQASGMACVVSDSITDEVKVTNLVKFVSLSQPVLYWVNIIIKMLEIDRYNTYSDFIKTGYDIEGVSKWYHKFYIN